MSARHAVVAALAVVVMVVAAPTDASAFKRCGDVRPTMKGTPNADFIIGTPGVDVISAGAGNDRVEGLAGDDFICGGPGNDTLQGDEESDRLRGGAGDDALEGDDGQDTIRGQGGHDSADGGEGVDGCYTERSETCEADLDGFLAYFLDGLTAGDESPKEFLVGIRDKGPGATDGAYLEFVIPAEARFVATMSDSRCRLTDPTVVSCEAGVLDPTVYAGPASTARFRVWLAFPECPPSPMTEVAFGARALALYTTDPRPEDNFSVMRSVLQPASTCP